MSAPLYRFKAKQLDAMDRVCHAMIGVWARNLKGYAFLSRLDDESKAEIKGVLRAPLESGLVAGRRFRCDGEYADGTEVWGTHDRKLSVHLCGVDHLKVVMMPQPGCEGWEAGAEAAMKVVRAYEKRFEFARDDRYGYYTASPLVMGTGCHLAVFMQLGGLKATGALGRVERARHEGGFGLKAFGPAGGWNWLETRVSMGVGDWRLVYGMLRAAGEVAVAEWNARERLFKRDALWVEDRVGRAMGILEGARQLELRESLDMLTWLELACQSGRYPLAASPWDFFGAVNRLMPQPLPVEVPAGLVKAQKLGERMARLAALKYDFHQWRTEK